MDVTGAILAFGFSPLVAFAVAVVVDDVLGVAVAVKTKTFDAAKFPSFLASQFGTKEALVVAAAAFAAYQTGGNVKAAATAVVVAGGSALTVSVAKDILDKIKALVAKPAAPAAAAKK
jgi:ketopantoate hydroxymethyltransferase